MPLSVSEELEQRVAEQVADSEYDSPTSLLSDALDALEVYREAIPCELERRSQEVESGAVEAVNPEEFWQSHQERKRAFLKARE